MIEVWIDGLCEPVMPANERTACLGYVIKKDGVVVEEGFEVIGKGRKMTNNVAEYSALIQALERVRSLGLKGRMVVRSDSKLVVNQMKGEWKVKATKIMPLYREAVALAKDMDVVFEWIPREENTEADSLARKAYEDVDSSSFLKRTHRTTITCI
jgi:ribonuclease HI